MALSTRLGGTNSLWLQFLLILSSDITEESEEWIAAKFIMQQSKFRFCFSYVTFSSLSTGYCNVLWIGESEASLKRSPLLTYNGLTPLHWQFLAKVEQARTHPQICRPPNGNKLQLILSFPRYSWSTSNLAQCLSQKCHSAEMWNSCTLGVIWPHFSVLRGWFKIAHANNIR